MQFLIVKTSSLGDIIHCFGVADFLKRKFPGCSIDWVVESPFAALLEAHPLIRDAIRIKTKLWRKNPLSSQTRQEYAAFKKQLQSKTYEAVFDLQGNIKSGWITHLSRSDAKIGFGRKSIPEWPNLLFTSHRYNPPPGQNIRNDYLFLPRSYFNDFITPASDKIDLRAETPNCPMLPSAYKVMVCPGSAWKNKQLDVEALAEFMIIKQVETKAHYLVCWGTEDEKEMADYLSMRVPHTQAMEKLSIAQLQKMMAQMDLIIAVDSLPLHLAGTTHVKTLSFFGPSLASKYAPLGESNASIQGSCPYQISFEKRCPKLRTCSTGACIKQIIKI